MFGFFGKKKQEFSLYAPLQGTVIGIETVADEVFSQKIMGDGIAVEPTNNQLVAPCDGQIILVAKTKHAIAIRAQRGLELLLHVGMDTVELAGEGFTCHVQEGQMVKQGELLLEFDRELLTAKGKKLTTPMVITNGEATVSQLVRPNFGGGGPVLQVTLK